MTIKFYRPSLWNSVSGLLQVDHKSKKWQWRHNFPTWNHRQFEFFLCCRVSLVKFSYWSKIHVNIITGSRVMTIFLYKGLTRNPETGNIPFWDTLGIPNLAWMSLMKCYWILQNARVAALTVFELLRENQQWWVILSPPPTQIRVKT